MIQAHEVIMANNFSKDCMFVIARRFHGSTSPALLSLTGGSTAWAPKFYRLWWMRLEISDCHPAAGCLTSNYFARSNQFRFVLTECFVLIKKKKNVVFILVKIVVYSGFFNLVQNGFFNLVQNVCWDYFACAALVKYYIFLNNK